MRFGCNAYMTRVAEVREPERYVEAAKDANWRAAMEDEMHVLGTRPSMRKQEQHFV